MNITGHRSGFVNKNVSGCSVSSGASLVKGIPFNPSDPEVSGPDIFKKLVPLEAHKASSLYRFISGMFDL